MTPIFECKLISLFFRKDTIVIEGLLGETNGQASQDDYTLAYRFQGTFQRIESHPFVLKDVETRQPSFSGRLFKLVVPLQLIGKETLELQLFAWWQAHSFPIHKISTFSLTAIEHSLHYKRAYFASHGFLLKRIGACFYLQRASAWRFFKAEVGYLLALITTFQRGWAKILSMRLKTFLFRFFKRRPIWLIMDSISLAKDNGEAFFRYLRMYHANEVEAYFVISSKSPDYHRLKKTLGHVVPFRSRQHKRLHLLADLHLHSFLHYNLRNPFGGRGDAWSDLYAATPVLYLGHGVINGDHSLWLNKTKSHMGVVIASSKEMRWLALGGFREEDLWLTGFPRLDVDQNQGEKMILFNPTWRRDLTCGGDPKTGQMYLVEGIESSPFIQMWTTLLNHPRLIDAAKQYGYSMHIKWHPLFAPALHRFPPLAFARLLEEGTTYVEMLSRGALMVTDYSSVVFDFASLRKPIVYFQFDRDSYYGGVHAVGETIPPYEAEGLGEVTMTIEDAVDVLVDYMKQNCALKPLYRKRIEETLPLSSCGACARLYEKAQAFLHSLRL